MGRVAPPGQLERLARERGRERLLLRQCRVLALLLAALRGRWPEFSRFPKLAVNKRSAVGRPLMSESGLPTVLPTDPRTGTGRWKDPWAVAVGAEELARPRGPRGPAEGALLAVAVAEGLRAVLGVLWELAPPALASAPGSKQAPSDGK